VHTGQSVRVTEGPFAGLFGSLDEILEQRVVIIIDLQGRPVKVEMDQDWVKPSPRHKSVSPIVPHQLRSSA
jgi:transcription antitermination factor NusG